MKIPVRFQLDDPALLPTRHYDGDCGFDLYTASEMLIHPGEFRDIPCGCRVALPPGVWGRICGRSSTLRRMHLLVTEGIIDTVYRGPLFAGAWNLDQKYPVMVPAKARVAQLILHRNTSEHFTPVEVTDEEFVQITGDGRGDQGFGSTGWV